MKATGHPEKRDCQNPGHPGHFESQNCLNRDQYSTRPTGVEIFLATFGSIICTESLSSPSNTDRFLANSTENGVEAVEASSVMIEYD